MALAECENMHDAANRLGKSVAALSLQIKRLEEMAGAPLFDRARRGKRTMLSDLGRQYHSRISFSLPSLAPSHLVPSPTPEVIELDFETGIVKALPKLQRFWNDLVEVDFDLRRDPDRTYALRNVSVSFRLEEGEWIYNHLGRRNEYAELMGKEFCSQAIGKRAYYRQPSGLLDSYDWSVTKAYNSVFITGCPSLARIVAWLGNHTDEKKLVSYERLVVKVQTPDGPMILVNGGITDYDVPPASQDAMVQPLPLDQVGAVDRTLADFHTAWKISPIWNSDKLRPFHNRTLMCRPLLPLTETLIITHVGQHHTAVRHFGETWPERAIGAPVADMDIWGNSSDCTVQSYYETLKTGIPSFDQVTATFQTGSGSPTSAVYFRLLSRCYLSDGTPVVVNMTSPPSLFPTYEEALSHARSAYLCKS